MFWVAIILKTLTIKGMAGLYKPVGGAVAIFVVILIMLHIRDPFLN